MCYAGSSNLSKMFRIELVLHKRLETDCWEQRLLLCPLSFSSPCDPVGLSGSVNGWRRGGKAHVTWVKPFSTLALSLEHIFSKLHPSKSFVNLTEKKNFDKALFWRFYLLYFRKGYSLHTTEAKTIQRLINTHMILLDFGHKIKKVSKKIFKIYTRFYFFLI